jgi:hypothetical protein
MSAMVGTALVLSLTAGATAASQSPFVTLKVTTGPSLNLDGTFVATGAAPCKSGTTADVRSQGIAVGHFIVWKQFTCAGSPATFVLRFDVHIPQPFAGTGSHDYGTWTVDGASDASLRGSGVFVGTYFGSDPNALGIVDRLVGVMRH